MSGAPHPEQRRARLAETIGSWRAALRIARREAKRARGRTALVLAMIILPVLALTFVAVSVDMSRLSAAEHLERRLGVADAELRVVARGPLVQSPDGDGWNAEEYESSPIRLGVERVEALLPPGSRLLPLHRWVFFPAWDGERFRDDISATVVDLTDPLGRGLVRLHTGRVPATADEIAVNLAAGRALDVGVGDRISTRDSAGDRTVVGVVEFPDQLDPAVFVPPASALPEMEHADEAYLVALPEPITDDLFRHLNNHGIVVASRTPAPSDPVFEAGDMASGANVEEVGSGVLIGGLGLLEVVLLVGPAFAVGVRRRRRDLALVAVAGGDAAQLRRVVLADGVVLGCVGAAVGIVIGVVTAFTGRSLVEQFIFGYRFAGYRFWPAALVAIALVAVLAGVLAALVPAWTAARQDVVAGLAGRRTPPRHSRRWLIVGVLLAVGGAGVAALGAVVTSQSVILAGMVMGELGLVCATPMLVGLLARLGRFLPLAARIAVRDASRQRSSTAPAISAVMAAVAASVALGLVLASDQERNAVSYPPQLPRHSVLISVNGPPDTRLPTLAEITDPARQHLGARTIIPLVSAGCRQQTDSCLVVPVLPTERACPWQAHQPLSEAQQIQARADARCQGPVDDYYAMYPRTVVDDGSALPILTGAAPDDVAAATATLRAGGAVLTDNRYLVDGQLRLSVQRDPEEPVRIEDTTTVPGHTLEIGYGSNWLLLSPAAAERLGLTPEQTGWALDVDEPPGQRQQEAFTAATRSLAPLELEFHDDRRLGDTVPLLLLLAGVSAVVTVGAAGIATGLAAAEGRADLSTLAAVGASPGVRRLLSLCQSGVISVLGSVLGIVGGLVAAVIILGFTNQRYAESWPVEPTYPLVIPWLTLGVLVVVPLVAMLGAALFTRSRLPVERRLDSL
ncbi:FtsX-like permease family protein [Micromonospora endophytica]|uniref:ABC transporter n=1 Tax=Micromonospora endophytica TaxID=515350 RepID=A0A2W2CA65_9ACTN|nr:ABC transporter permease [Micromonospora endophytica]PZF96221.1 ABC transporter [Micromonospora endophytica]RIW50334.1 ABC transporter permease [Micromonospora endophytica]BCJ57874.1 hypothetical protein Jiend_12960 [Micromonospora endophytica]